MRHADEGEYLITAAHEGTKIICMKGRCVTTGDANRIVRALRCFSPKGSAEFPNVVADEYVLSCAHSIRTPVGFRRPDE
jgi:hypothetical protein